MIIRELILKNFGRFRNRSIRLEEGINIIYGENESGKSTLHAFIQGMLFGLRKMRGRAARDVYKRQVLIRKDGRFVVPELEVLNPENLQ